MKTTFQTGDLIVARRPLGCCHRVKDGAIGTVVRIEHAFYADPGYWAEFSARDLLEQPHTDGRYVEQILRVSRGEIEPAPAGTDEKPHISLVTVDWKDTNPKDAIGCDKVALSLWPSTATALGAIALLDGHCKYGKNNFRAVGVRASIYIDAALRHITAYNEGEDIDPDSGVPHLGHALACLAILVEGHAQGNMTDDRNYGGRNALAYARSLTPHVRRLRNKHVGKNPKHYTIQDERDKAA